MKLPRSLGDVSVTELGWCGYGSTNELLKSLGVICIFKLEGRRSLICDYECAGGFLKSLGVVAELYKVCCASS